MHSFVTRGVIYPIVMKLGHQFKVFRCSFSEAIPIFSIVLKVFFYNLSDRYKIFTSNWRWIEICENVMLGMGRTWQKFSSLPAKKPQKFETPTRKENLRQKRRVAIDGENSSVTRYRVVCMCFRKTHDDIDRDLQRCSLYIIPCLFLMWICWHTCGKRGESLGSRLYLSLRHVTWVARRDSQ